MTAVARGAGFVHSVALTAPNGAALDTSGYDAWATLREANKSNLPIVTLLRAGGRVTISAGLVDFILTAADTGSIETDNCLLDYFVEDDFGAIVRSGTASVELTGAIIPPSSAPSPYTPAAPTNWGTIPTTFENALDFLVDTVPVYGQVLYVYPGGSLSNDANSGNQYAPLNTLQEAVDRFLASTVTTTIRIINSIPAGDTLHLNTGLSVAPGTNCPSLIVESRNSQRVVISGDVYIHGSKGISVYFNHLQLDTQALVPNAPNLRIIQSSNNIFASFDDCEISRLELNSEGILFTNVKRVSFRDTIIRNGPIADILFTNIALLEFHDCWIDPFSPLSLNNIWFIRTDADISKILIMSASVPEAGVISDGVIPVFGYRNFSQKNPEFLVSGGGQIRIGIANDIVFSATAPDLTMPSGVVMELLNCKALSNFAIQAGATLETTHCRLPAVANDGTWTDYGSTVVSVSGDGTTTYNGTVVATIPVITAATRTQLRTDMALDFDAASNSIAYNLLSLASTPLDHKISLLRKPGGGANTVTITPNGAETIDGLASVTLVEYQHTALVNKGTFWSAQ